MKTELDWVKLRSLYQEIPEHTILLNQGEAPKALYILISGTVDIYRNGRFLASIRKRGEYIGEISVLKNINHSATVKAKTDLTVIEITVDKAHTFFYHKPEVAVSIARKLAERLVEVNQKFADLQKLSKTSFKSDKKPMTEDEVVDSTADTEGKDASSLKENEILDYDKLKSLFIEFPVDYFFLKQGYTPKALYILVSGTVEILKDNKTIGYESERGTYFGEVSLLRNSPSNASVKVIKQSTLIEIEAQKMEQYLSRSPEIAISMAKNLAERIIQINDDYLKFLSKVKSEKKRE